VSIRGGCDFDRRVLWLDDRPAKFSGGSEADREWPGDRRHFQRHFFPFNDVEDN
jgi:hypothetical protein